VGMNIEQHYKDNYRKFVKRMTFRAGSEFDAEDIVQDAYERAIRYSNKATVLNFDKWFNMLLNNSLKDFKSNEKGFSSSVFDEDENEGTACDNYPSRIVIEINQLIETKSVAQIEVLNLWFKEEYSPVDISRITLHSHSSARQIIKRFRDELRGLYS
jgi:RNA polymerase sigma factor (sigma-70 family)